MQVKYIIIMIILLIFLYLNLSENQDIEKMISTNFSANNKIKKINLIKPGEKVEILDLPYCKKNFKVEYGSNINFILNDGKKIYQDVLKPFQQIAYIGNNKQGLVQISWKKSFFTFNNKPVPLELHLTHQDPKSGKITRIIFPLSLESNIIENFSINNSINKIGKLSLLLKKPTDVPNLIKGTINTGKIASFNVCDSDKYIIEQNKFFIAQLPNNETIMIAKPQKFDKKLGLSIIKNLLEPDYDFINPKKN
jgi:hypothetical protein